jgi:hypothetical protein
MTQAQTQYINYYGASLKCLQSLKNGVTTQNFAEMADDFADRMGEAVDEMTVEELEAADAACSENDEFRNLRNSLKGRRQG